MTKGGSFHCRPFSFLFNPCLKGLTLSLLAIALHCGVSEWAPDQVWSYGFLGASCVAKLPLP